MKNNVFAAKLREFLTTLFHMAGGTLNGELAAAVDYENGQVTIMSLHHVLRLSWGTFQRFVVGGWVTLEVR